MVLALILTESYIIIVGSALAMDVPAGIETLIALNEVSLKYVHVISMLLGIKSLFSETEAPIKK